MAWPCSRSSRPGLRAPPAPSDVPAQPGVERLWHNSHDCTFRLQLQIAASLRQVGGSPTARDQQYASSYKHVESKCSVCMPKVNQHLITVGRPDRIYWRMQT